MRLDKIKHFITIKDLAGIHLDYLRYPGANYTKEINPINIFIVLALRDIKNTNKDLIVSSTFIPEINDGQDFNFMSECFDVIVPLIFKGKFKKDTKWIGKTTSYFVKKSQHSKIWVGLQTYENDENKKKLSYLELKKDSKTVINAKGKGIILYRYDLSEIINFRDPFFIRLKSRKIKN